MLGGYTTANCLVWLRMRLVPGVATGFVLSIALGLKVETRSATAHGTDLIYLGSKSTDTCALLKGLLRFDFVINTTDRRNRQSGSNF